MMYKIQNRMIVLLIVSFWILSITKVYSQCDATLAYWDFNDCTKGNMVKDGTSPTSQSNGGCSDVDVTISRVDPANSCVDRPEGHRGNCFGESDLLAWEDHSDKAVIISIDYPAGAAGSLSGVEFELSVQEIVEFANEPNHYPTLWGIRVTKDGVEIFKDIDNPFILGEWTNYVYDWSTDPNFEYNGATHFEIELMGYLPGNENTSSNREVWELDNLYVYGGCCQTSSQCDISDSGLTNVTCSITSGPTSGIEHIEFNLNPTGTGLGSGYVVSVDGGYSISPTTASYGTSTLFQLNGGSAGSGDRVITITDIDNGNCTIIVTLPDPGSCVSPVCDITNPGLANINCNDSGTTSDTSDDYITFDLNPTGTTLGSNYTVSISSGTISPTTANYGSVTTFTLNLGSAGSGNKTVIISDATSGACNFAVLIDDPGNCSPDCPITTYDLCTSNSYTITAQSGLTNIQWQVDNGTGYADISGETGTTLIVSQPGTYKYVATDANGCYIELCCPYSITECYVPCNLSSDGLQNINCNDNGSLQNGLDDIISFELNPTGTGLSSNYVVSVSGGGAVTPSIAAYGTSTTFNLSPGSAGSGDITIVISDENNSACSLEVVVSDPGVCSGCLLNNPTVSAINCSNGGTPSESDDKIVFTLDMTGTNTSNIYYVFVDGGFSITPSSGVYGQTASFAISSGSAGAGDRVITIVDKYDSSCSTSIVISDPGTCSSCQLEEPIVAYFVCGASGEQTLWVQAMGLGLSTTYDVSVTCTAGDCSSCNATGLLYADGLQSVCTIPSGFGMATVTFTDASGNCFALRDDVSEDSNCPLCSLTDAGVMTVCDDAGTGDPSDDTFTVTLNPTGSGIGGTYSVSGDITAANIAYGSAQAVGGSFLISGGDLTITITDDATGTCTLVDVVVPAPAPCSTCNLLDGGISAVYDNKGTTDTGDDTWVIFTNPNGSGTSATYTVSGDVSASNVVYGSVQQVSEVPTSQTMITITITDDGDSNCQLSDMIFNFDPNGVCDLVLNPTTVCDDAGTPTDPSDDTFTISLNPTGTGLGTTYSISGDITQANVAYGSVQQIGTSYLITDGAKSITLTDDANNLCRIDEVISAPLACSSTCPQVDPVQICNDGVDSVTLEAEAGTTNVVWYNSSDVQVGTGSQLIVTSATPGMEDGSDSYYYTANDANGCAGALCCPVAIETIDCCPAPQCVGVTITKN
ncbi:MAG: hypothetical protein R2798_04175 [Chitinophagales bacterium]